MDTILLSECLKNIVDNRGKTCPSTDKGIPLIATNCIKEESIYPTFEKVRYVSEETYNNWFRGHPNPGDILFVNKGTPGRVCLVPDPINFCIAQDMVALQVDDSVIYPPYLFAALRSNQVRKSIENMHVGTMIPHFKKGDFDLLELPLPKQSKQIFIGDFYRTFSEKIFLNKKNNETLEEIAKALFKSWFIDFDPVRAKAEGRSTGLSNEISDLFPDSFEDSELGEIPKNWGNIPISQFIEINPSRKITKGKVAPYLEMKGVPTSGHTVTGVYDREFTSGTKFQQGDTLLARITPCLENGKTAMVDFLDEGQIGWGSTEFIVICGKEKKYNPFVYYLSRSETFREHAIRNMIGSSGRQRVPSDSLYDFTIAKPPITIIKLFSEIASSFLQKITNRSKEISSLESIRNILLPKLMSGEVSITDAEKMIEEVGI